MKGVIAEVKKHMAYKDLLWLLVSRDHEVKYKNSFLGYIWSMLDPILMMIVLTIVFSTFFRSQIPNYPVYLMSGRMLFGYVTSSGGQGMRSIIGNANLLQKTFVPKYIFPLAKVTSGFVDLWLESGALVLAMVLTGVRFSVNMLYIPLIYIQAYLLAFGLGLFLAQLAVFFRDTLYIYSVVTTAWMYLTPLFYPLENIPYSVSNFIIKYNPVFPLVYNFRLIILRSMPPDKTMLFRSWEYAVIMLIIGSIAFYTRKDEFILHL